MKKISTLLMLMILLTSLQSYEQGFSPKVQSRLQKIIDSFQNNPSNPYIGGVSVAIKVDELADWKGATGFAARNIDAQNNLLPGGTPFNTETLSRIYSITKTFTAPLVLELAKKGAFNLDEPLVKYLPALPLVNPGLSTAVTIRQLLVHESGYSDYTVEMQLQIAVAFNPRHIWTPYEMASFVHQVDAPGALRRYSSTNYILLGAIIEVATNKTVEQHFRERFFDPLQLASMYFGGRESIGNRGTLAAPHDNISVFNPIFQFTGQPTFPDEITNISRFPFGGIVSLAFTSGGIVSDASDVTSWGNALFSGKAISQSIIDEMIQSISSNPDDDGDYLGYGLIRTTKISATETFIGHDGNAPGYRSIMFYQPEKKLTLTLLTNYHGANLYTVAKALYEALPEFLCGNNKKKEDKIEVCFNGNNLCISRAAAPGFMKKGAYLGACDQSTRTVKKNDSDKQKEAMKENSITAFPNPFSSNVTLSFKVNQAGPVSLRVYDLNGKLVANLFNRQVEKTVLNQVIFDAGRLPLGVYISRLQTVSGTTEQKIVKTR